MITRTGSRSVRRFGAEKSRDQRETASEDSPRDPGQFDWTCPLAGSVFGADLCETLRRYKGSNAVDHGEKLPDAHFSTSVGGFYLLETALGDDRLFEVIHVW